MITHFNGENSCRAIISIIPIFDEESIYTWIMILLVLSVRRGVSLGLAEIFCLS